MISEKNLESIFTEHKNVKGLPGTKMENFGEDFKAFIYELNAHKDVFITHLFVGFPYNYQDKGWKNFIVKPLGFELDLEISSFYTQFSDISLRWVNLNHPSLGGKKPKSFKLYNCTTKMDVDDDNGIGKNILIKTGSQLFNKKNQVIAQPEGYNLYYFNYSHFFSGQLAFNVNKEKKEIELYRGDDYFADVSPLSMDFPTYMYKIIELNEEIVSDAAKD
ncbi:MAG: hypothetical protein HXX09_14330 [Bacteroidetes bacterium]|nr:hypothetical protein [Bacteroidota bacterium]